MNAAINFKPSEERKTLLAFFSNVPPGARLSWVEIEQQTGVNMDVPSGNRATVFSVLQKLKTPYFGVRGVGIEIASKESALDYATKQVTKAVSAHTKAAKRVDVVTEKHAHEMPQEDKNRLTYIQAVFSTMNLKQSVQKALKK